METTSLKWTMHKYIQPQNDLSKSVSAGSYLTHLIHSHKPPTTTFLSFHIQKCISIQWALPIGGHTQCPWETVRLISSNHSRCSRWQDHDPPLLNLKQISPQDYPLFLFCGRLWSKMRYDQAYVSGDSAINWFILIRQSSSNSQVKVSNVVLPAAPDIPLCPGTLGSLSMSSSLLFEWLL